MKFESPIRVSAILLATLSVPSLARAQAVVDHRVWQTPVQSQGNRGTCIMFSAIAALEAQYRRNGMTVDLSEEFCNYVHKTFWLNRGWAPIATGGADWRENQVGAFGGGEGTGIARQLAGGYFAVPLESYMPYRPTEYPGLPPWDDPYWDSQFTANSFNLDPVNLPRSALKAPAYYAASGYVDIANPRSITAIESALQAGFDVVWDFDVNGDRSGSIWRFSQLSTSIGSHSMLIVGYDRSSPNPANWYFVAKNSWGQTSNPGGYTYIAYNYIQYGQRAGYITGAAQPRSWPELRFIGRRNICFDGWRGILDVYHLPNVMDSWFAAAGISIADRRIGTFYDHNGVAHRVNGWASGDTLSFWFKAPPNENMRWDEGRETPTVGRLFKYVIVDGDGKELAGQHHDNPGPNPNPPFGGYARMPSTILANDGYLAPVFDNSQPIAPEQWLGRWHLKTAGFTPDVYVKYRDDTRLSPSQAVPYAGLVCDLVEPGTGQRIEFVARVHRANPNWMNIQLSVPAMGGSFATNARMLSWQRGVSAGFANVGTQTGEGCYGWRYGSHYNGLVTQFGTSCGPQGWQPWHDVLGHPELAEPVRFALASVPANTAAVLAMGLDRTQSGNLQLPFPLANLGAPSCYVRVDPLVTVFGLADVQGYLEVTQTFQHPQLLGQDVYSQFFALQAGANALGMTASNGVDVLLGGGQ